MAYENSVFSDIECNWPDFRDLPNSTGPSFMTAWCHGAAGIGLARVGGLAYMGNTAIRQDIEHALKRSRHHQSRTQIMFAAATSAASISCWKPASASDDRS